VMLPAMFLRQLGLMLGRIAAQGETGS
jgi:hypothetical protein